VPSSSESNRRIFDPEKEGAPSLQNVDYYLPINIVQHPRRLETFYND
jgi:hypothetical protein